MTVLLLPGRAQATTLSGYKLFTINALRVQISSFSESTNFYIDFSVITRAFKRHIETPNLFVYYIRGGTIFLQKLHYVFPNCQIYFEKIFLFFLRKLIQIYHFHLLSIFFLSIFFSKIITYNVLNYTD